jgi:virginiamycin B lyase
VVHEGGRLWLGNRLFDQIIRFDPLEPEITWWEIPGGTAWPLGLAVDGQGNVWWADLGLDAVGRLDPASGQMTLYELPASAGNDPQMVEPRGSRVWVTGGSDGTLGILDPAVAGGQTSTPPSGSGDWSQSCAELGAGSTDSLAASETGSLAWTTSSLAPSHGAGGWTVYPLPSGAAPYGLAAASDYVWVTDPGRDSLHRFEPPQFRVFLPLVSRR